ncbi:MAG: alpha/beta hydrolase, partial [Archaeoglobaceae archaeon]
MPFAYVNGIKLYYEVYGSGFPLLMIMGLGGNVLWWDPLILNEFSKHFKVVVFDNRGSGRSDKPDGEYSIKIFADDTVELMNSLGINKAHILG